MAGRDDQLRRIAGIRSTESSSLPRHARIDLAVGRTHREVVDRSLRHAFLHRHFRRRIVSRPDDEVSRGIRRRYHPVRQFLRRDIPGRAGIASRRRRARRGSWCRCRSRGWLLLVALCFAPSPEQGQSQQPSGRRHSVVSMSCVSSQGMRLRKHLQRARQIAIAATTAAVVFVRDEAVAYACPDANPCAG